MKDIIIKKIYLFSIICSSFFLFSSNILAETYNYTIPSYLTSLTEEDFTKINNLLSSNGLSNANYIVWSRDSTSPRYQVYTFSRLSFTSDFRLDYGNCRLWQFDNSLTTLTSLGYSCPTSGTISILPREQQTFYFILLHTNFSFTYPDYNNTFNYTYKDKVFTQPVNNDLKIYTIYDYYVDYNRDPFPLLTNFFTIVTDKLELVCQFFTSNYIYLSIFVILFIYFSILLVRRLL